MNRYFRCGGVVGRRTGHFFEKLTTMKKVKVIQEEQKKAVAAKAEPEKEEDEKAEGIDIEPKAEITYDDFAKLQFQIGEIVKCEAVPKSKKASLLPGKDRNQDPPDRKRYQGSLLTRGNGRKESYGSNQLKAC